jgi:S-adenosylmethionine hydrolase
VTNIDGRTLGELGSCRIELLGRALPLVGTYGDAAAGDCVAVVGSFGQIEVVKRDGSAALALGAQRGTSLRVHRV